MKFDTSWISLAIELVVLFVSLIVAWQKLVDKLNGMGERMAEFERSCEQQTGQITQMNNEIEGNRRSNIEIARRLGETESGYRAMSEKITEMRIDITGHLGEIKNLITEKDASTRERIAKLEERNGRREDKQS